MAKWTTSTDNLEAYPFIQEKKKILPYTFVKKKGVIPLDQQGKILTLALSDTCDLETLEEVKYITGCEVREVLVAQKEIDIAIEICYQQKDEEASKYIQGLENETKTSIENESEYDLLDHNTDSSIIKLLNMVILEALGQGASDIHFEPVENGHVVRYRVDGVLLTKHSLSKELESPLTTRIKVLAKLDIAEHRLPQDGRIKLRMGGREIDFRVSTVPVVFGERIVLRILDRSQIVLGLDQLGLRKGILDKVRKCIKQTQGIILVTGPTGSGKTTTLYAALSEICSNEVNIMTIEDPVEFKLAGLAQINVNPKIKLDFATGLRHILRQDPDVIMIGEIRDKETAEIAIQASLTGHLVLSTLHTNDAASAIARLVDMGIEPYLLSSSLIGVVAQRLVRCLCPSCKKTNPNCKNCFGTGYKGRHGIYELMPVTTRIKNQILQSADSNLLTKIAIEQGMSNLRTEGETLVKAGITTLEEVLRATRGMDDD